MSDFPWSIIISGIALVVSVTSPLITSIINNHHQDKVWNREHFSLYRIQAIESYVRSTGIVLKKATSETITAYGDSFGLIFFYAPESTWEKIIQIDRAIVSRNITSDTHELFSELCKELSKVSKRPEN